MEMNRNSARLLAQNPQILKRLAKYMAQQCFRNTVLENFHAGITPYSEAGDYSDVVVKTPPVQSRGQNSRVSTIKR